MKIHIVSGIYAEFIDHFLTIIQDPAQQNAATLYSGFLRAHQLPAIIESLSWDSTFIPLSAVLDAGLIDENFRFLTLENANEEGKRKINSIGFFVDIDRLNGAMKGFHKDRFNQVQQLILATAFQEATNRILTNNPERFQGIDDEKEDGIQRSQLLQELATMALGQSAKDIVFLLGANKLTKDSIKKLEAHRSVCFEMSKISDEDLSEDGKLKSLSQTKMPALLPASISIEIFNELIPTLALNVAGFTPEQTKIHQAQLLLLKLHSMVFSMVLHEHQQNATKKKINWAYSGKQIILSDGTMVTLPGYISNILEIIEQTVIQKSNYMEALTTIKDLAMRHSRDWLVWTTNFLPFFSASPSSTDFLRKVLDVDIQELDQPTPVAELGKDFRRRASSSGSQEMKEEINELPRRRRTESLSCVFQVFFKAQSPSSPHRRAPKTPPKTPPETSPSLIGLGTGAAR